MTSNSLTTLSRRTGGRTGPLFWLVAACLLLGVLVAAYYEFGVNMAEARSVLPVIEKEYSMLGQLPGAAHRPVRASSGTRHALVGTSYVTDLRYPELRAYFDAELSKRGWAFSREERVREWGEDLGGVKALYCKGDYVASLQYGGERARHDWTYTFYVSWRFEDCR
jgi:hypothetical protein